MPTTENAGIYYPPGTGAPRRADQQLLAESVDRALMLSKEVEGAMAGGHTGTAVFQRDGRWVMPSGGVIRQIAPTTSFTPCAYVPVGFRPNAVWTFPETPAWNGGAGGVIYQLSVNPAGVISVRMNGEVGGAMSLNLPGWVTLQPLPPVALP